MEQDTYDANEIPLAEAKSTYQYNPDTGEILKRVDDGLKRIGHIDSRGYISILHSGVTIKAHRLAYALYHGEWPSNELDHVNRIKTDNRIVNLRLADRFINNQNRVFKSQLLKRKAEIFQLLLANVMPSEIPDLEEHFPYSFKK